MPTPSTPPIWTLNASGITPVGSDGVNLVGCHITTNAAGTAYEFTKPNINDVLSTTTGTSLPSVPFTFPVFTYKGFDWTVTVSSLPAGSTGSGTWSTPGSVKRTGAQNGDFTAQSGSGIDEVADAQSAKAYGGTSS